LVGVTVAVLLGVGVFDEVGVGVYLIISKY
jgi:hypothetical protein